MSSSILSLLPHLNRDLRKFSLGRAVAVFLILSTAAFAQTKLLRFPDIHGDRVAFTYGGDIWTAPATGGSAIRLTAHPGVDQERPGSLTGRIAFPRLTK